MASRKSDRNVEASIISAASELYAANGVFGASLGDIAKKVAISKGTVYYYYPTKQDITYSVAELALRDIGDRIFSWVDTISKEDSLETTLDTLCDYLLGERDPLLIYLAVNRTAESDRALEAMLDRALNEWNVMLEVGILRMNTELSERMRRICAAIMPFICGLAAMNADLDYSKAAFRALVLG